MPEPTQNHIRPDVKPFNGKAFYETMVSTEVTMNELQAIEVSRSIEFGEIVIKKARGSIIQILKHESVQPKELEPKIPKIS